MHFFKTRHSRKIFIVTSSLPGLLQIYMLHKGIWGGEWGGGGGNWEMDQEWDYSALASVCNPSFRPFSGSSHLWSKPIGHKIYLDVFASNGKLVCTSSLLQMVAHINCSTFWTKCRKNEHFFKTKLKKRKIVGIIRLKYSLHNGFSTCLHRDLRGGLRERVIAVCAAWGFCLVMRSYHSRVICLHFALSTHPTSPYVPLL